MQVWASVDVLLIMIHINIITVFIIVIHYTNMIKNKLPDIYLTSRAMAVTFCLKSEDYVVDKLVAELNGEQVDTCMS